MSPSRVGRRALVLGALGASLAACRTAGATGAADVAPSFPPRRYAYGSEPQQYGDLRLPSGTPLALLVLLHGGAFVESLTADQMNPLAERLTGLGYATWNVEYRRLGNGGGFPNTFLDVAAAVDRVQGTPYAGKVVVLGHSAGGHLTAWTASRSSRTPGGPSRVALRGAISLSGGLDFTADAALPDVGRDVVALMGGTPRQVPGRYAVTDPSQLLPPTCPVWAAQAVDDEIVPRQEAPTYVDRVRAAGGRAVFVPLPGDHSALIDPDAPSFPGIRSMVEQATR